MQHNSKAQESEAVRVSLVSLQLSVLLEIQTQVTTFYDKYLVSLSDKVCDLHKS